MSVQWTGLAQFMHELRDLPEQLTDEAGQIVMSAAQDAERDVAAAYPSVSGNLKRGVRSFVDSHSRFGASARVKSGAPHAHLFEKGSRPRHYHGASRGVMPAAPAHQAAIPIFIRARRVMVDKLIRMVQAAGLTVTHT